MIEFEAGVYPPGRTGGMTRLKVACQAQHHSRSQTSTPTRVGQQGGRKDSRGEIEARLCRFCYRPSASTHLYCFCSPRNGLKGTSPPGPSILHEVEPSPLSMVYSFGKGESGLAVCQPSGCCRGLVGQGRSPAGRGSVHLKGWTLRSQRSMRRGARPGAANRRTFEEIQREWHLRRRRTATSTTSSLPRI